MTALKVLAFFPLWFLLVANTIAASAPSASPSDSPSASPTPTPTPTPTPSPTPTPPPTPSPSPVPTPTPTPTGAFISLDVTAGVASTVITVSGNAFLPGEQMSIFWDTQTKVLGSTNTDGNGNFTGVKVKPFAGDPPGLHKICAGVPPQPCAQFELQAPPSPPPSPSAPPGASPSPSSSPTASDSPTPSVLAVPVDSSSSLDALLRPPFVFLPIVAILGLLAALAYWLMSTNKANQPALPSTSIVHRSVRPSVGGPTPQVAAAVPGEPAPPPTIPTPSPEPPAAPPAPPPPPEDLPPPPLPPQAAGPETPPESSEPAIDEQPPWPKL